MSTRVKVTELPTCDIHTYEKGDPNVTAHYDGATIMGPWANMCAECFEAYGVGLGTGRGQELIPASEWVEETHEDRKARVDAAAAAGDIDAMLDAIGDGDITDYL